MDTTTTSVISADGTPITVDVSGSGPAVIMVGGAFSYRRYPAALRLAALLGEHFTVYNFDRRGRGDSGDTAPYAVRREIEDIDALIALAGGKAHMFGLSSGAALALEAAAAGLPIVSLVLYEPPYVVAGSPTTPPPDLEPHLRELIQQGRRSDAVRYFMTKGMGAPGFFVGLLRLSPVWNRLTGVAHTLPYDVAVMRGNLAGRPLPATPWAPISARALVLSGAKSPQTLRLAARAVADVLPSARLHVLEKQNHIMSPAKVAPVLTAFFND